MRKRFLWKNFILSIVLALVVVFLPVGQAKAATRTTSTTTTTTTTATSTAIKPVFGSSFIQYWKGEDWTVDQWKQEMCMLQAVGINEIVLQDIAELSSKYATYPTTISGFTCNNIDMVGNALTAADALGMKIRIGLGVNDDWWNKGTSDVTWLNTQASTNKTIVDEISANYGPDKHSSFAGWYIPFEFSQFTANTTTKQGYLNNFYKTIASEIKLKTPALDIMVAPFYNGKYSFLTSLSSWSTMVQNILKGTGINIVALQDSVGAGYNTVSQLGNLYSYTKKATDAIGMKLYADTETYTSTSSGNVPALQSRITTQLSSEKAYVQGFVAFSIDHFQNGNMSDQVKGYNDYNNYYLANK